MIPPKNRRCFIYNDKVVMSALDVQRLVASGDLLPDDHISTTTGETYFARHIASFRAPKWLRTLDSDPIVGLSKSEIADSDYDKMIAEMDDEDIEGLPPEATTNIPSATAVSELAAHRMAGLI